MTSIKTGDHVTHRREPGRIGEVVATTRDGFTGQPVYVVRWSEDGPGITYRSGLTKVDKAGE